MVVPCSLGEAGEDFISLDISSRSGQGKRGLPSAKRVKNSAADAHLHGKLELPAVCCGILSSTSSLPIPMACLPSSGVLLLEWSCKQRVAGIVLSHVVGHNKRGDLRISHPEHNLLQHCREVSTPLRSPAALPQPLCTGPSTMQAGRGPSSLLSMPAFCLLSNGMSHAPGRLGLYLRISF